MAQRQRPPKGTRFRINLPEKAEKKAEHAAPRAPATEAKGKEKKPASKPASAKARPQSAMQLIRRCLAEDPNASVQFISTVLEKAGVPKSASTIGTIKSDFTGCYRALVSAGALKEPVTL